MNRTISLGFFGIWISAIVLSACGSPSTQHHLATGSSSTTTPSSTTTSTSPPTTVSPSTTTTAAGQSGPARCHSTDLVVSVGQAGVATGAVGQVVTFKNVTSATCSLEGYPGLQMLSANGQPLPTSVIRGTSTTVSPVPAKLVILQPGASASFEVGYADHTGYPNTSCPTSSSVEITPPNAFHYLVASWQMAPFGGTASHTTCGQVTVSPVYAGTGRYQAG